MTHRRQRLAAAALTCVVVAGCGGDAGSESAEQDAPSVVASTSIWADVARHVACAAPEQVTTIVPAGGDPHSFEPSLQDRELLADADLVVANGGGLEASLDDVLDAVARDGTTVLRVTDHVPLLGSDPHVWMDPLRVAEAVPEIADALVAAGFDADAVETCSGGYVAALTELDGEIEQMLAPVRAERRFLVTSHEALAYFADRYGFTVVGAVIPGGSTLGETNAAELEELATAIEETGVSAVFSEEQHSATDIEALAAEVGDVSVISLFTDALGAPGSGAETYADLLRTDARLIAEGLSE